MAIEAVKLSEEAFKEKTLTRSSSITDDDLGKWLSNAKPGHYELKHVDSKCNLLNEVYTSCSMSQKLRSRALKLGKTISTKHSVDQNILIKIL